MLMFAPKMFCCRTQMCWSWTMSLNTSWSPASKSGRNTEWHEKDKNKKKKAACLLKRAFFGFRAWTFIMQNFRRAGCLLVTVPSLQESLNHLQVKPASPTPGWCPHDIVLIKISLLLSRFSCSRDGWRSFLWITTSIWEKMQTPKASLWSTCTGSCDRGTSYLRHTCARSCEQGVSHLFKYPTCCLCDKGQPHLSGVK